MAALLEDIDPSSADDVGTAEALRALLEGVVELFLLSEFDDPAFEETQLGGKAVVRVSDAASQYSQPDYVYGVGETVWVLSGQDRYIAALLRTMP